MSLKIINPVTDPAWQQLVENSNSVLFHSPAWIRVISEAYNWEPSARIIVDEKTGEARAGLPFFKIADFSGGRYVSLPFSDFCDPIVDTESDWNELIGDLMDTGAMIRMRCLHNALPVEDSRFKETGEAKWHQVDVRTDSEELWAQIHSSARRAIRKSQKQGVTIEFRSDEAALKEFFRLHLGIRKYKYRLLPQPYQFFQLIAKYFLEEQKGAVAMAIYDDTVVGCTMFLEWKDTLYYKFSASDLDQLAVRPTDLIIWEAIQYAQARGLSYLDFGLSDVDQEGLIRFKQKYATKEGKVTFLTSQQATFETPPSIQQVKKLFGNLTDLLTRESIPDEVTAQAGDLMYRFFT